MAERENKTRRHHSESRDTFSLISGKPTAGISSSVQLAAPPAGRRAEGADRVWKRLNDASSVGGARKIWGGEFLIII